MPLLTSLLSYHLLSIFSFCFKINCYGSYNTPWLIKVKFFSWEFSITDPCPDRVKLLCPAVSPMQNSADMTIDNRSTDVSFMDDGYCCFDLTRLSGYHHWNRLIFDQSLRCGIEMAVCDNRNLPPSQTAPYTPFVRYSGIFLRHLSSERPLSGPHGHFQ